MKRLHLEFARYWFELREESTDRQMRKRYDAHSWCSLLRWAGAEFA